MTAHSRFSMHGLGLDPADNPIRCTFGPMPARLTLITDPPQRAEAFDDIEALAMRIHELRRGRAMSVKLSDGSFADSDFFQAVSLSIEPPGGMAEWLCMVVIPHAEAGELRAALHTTRKHRREVAA